jgi:hypothetical protein
MSFDLAVWYSDVPLTNKEAGEIYTKLCKGQSVLAGGSSAVEAFYSELTSRWHEIDTVPDDKVDDFDYCPWSCALDKSAMHVIMACVWPKADDVATFVYELALKHGLVLFDPQHGAVHLPPNLKPKRSCFRFW